MGAKFILAFYTFLDIENNEKLIFFFKYPRLSNFFRICLVIFLITFDAAHMLSYLLAVFILILALKNDAWYAKVSPLFQKYFLSKLNPYINESKTVHIRTSK